MEITGTRLSAPLVKKLEPFNIEVQDRIGSGHGGHSTKFIRYKGDRIIGELLIKAGYVSGNWKVILREPFKATSHTPVIQVRRPDGVGVLIHVKPGDNATAVKCILVPPPGVDNLDVHDRMKIANEQPNEMNVQNVGVTEDVEVTAEEETPQEQERRDASQIVFNKDKLQKLASLPERLEKIKSDIEREKKKKEEVELRILHLEEQEQQLMKIDTKALAALLDSLD